MQLTCIERNQQPVYALISAVLLNNSIYGGRAELKGAGMTRNGRGWGNHESIHDV